MREIKFRVWDKKNKKMVTIIALYFFEGKSLEQISIDTDEGERQLIDIKNVEIMQYTGHKDKNGKEVYEGDILYEIEDDDIYIYIVVWDEETASFGLKTPSGWEYDFYYFIGDKQAFKLVGNIYENPELLGGGINDST